MKSMPKIVPVLLSLAALVLSQVPCSQPARAGETAAGSQSNSEAPGTPGGRRRGGRRAYWRKQMKEENKQQQKTEQAEQAKQWGNHK